MRPCFGVIQGNIHYTCSSYSSVVQDMSPQFLGLSRLTGSLRMSWEVPGCSLGLLTLGMFGKGCPRICWEFPGCSLGLLRPGTLGMSWKVPGYSLGYPSLQPPRHGNSKATTQDFPGLPRTDISKVPSLSSPRQQSATSQDTPGQPYSPGSKLQYGTSYDILGHP